MVLEAYIVLCFEESNNIVESNGTLAYYVRFFLKKGAICYQLSVFNHLLGSVVYLNMHDASRLLELQDYLN